MAGSPGARARAPDPVRRSTAPGGLESLCWKRVFKGKAVKRRRTPRPATPDDATARPGDAVSNCDVFRPRDAAAAVCRERCDPPCRPGLPSLAVRAAGARQAHVCAGTQCDSLHCLSKSLELTAWPSLSGHDRHVTQRSAAQEICCSGAAAADRRSAGTRLTARPYPWPQHPMAPRHASRGMRSSP